LCNKKASYSPFVHHRKPYKHGINWKERKDKEKKFKRQKLSSYAL
jgi:superfamily II helicase